MKKIISMLMAVLMVLPLMPVSAEYAPQFEYEAQMLYDLGLFKGTDKGFELDQKCDRLQAAALFVRLLGKESEALNNPKQHPFTDVPDWASPYVGQMYNDGYTKGISATEYGTGDVNATQFATFCLRALGYEDYENITGTYYAFFKYENALEKMLEEYILRQEGYDVIKQADVFLRDYAVKMAYNSLFAVGVDNSRRFLIRRLAENQVIDTKLLESRDIFIEDNIRYLYSVDSFKPYFEYMIREAATENKLVSIVNKYESKYVKLDNLNPASIFERELLYDAGEGGIIQHFIVTADDLNTNWYEKAAENANNSGGPVLYYKTEVDPTDSYYAMTYRCIRYITNGDVELTELETAVVAKTKEFLSTITADMSDYDKFKAAYDYLAENIKYEFGHQPGGTIAALVYGKGACGHYSTLYMYLCRLMNLECWTVGGKDETGGDHAWNKVKLDGKYYNVDPTWNNQGYKYFLFKDIPERTLHEESKIYDFPCTENYKH